MRDARLGPAWSIALSTLAVGAAFYAFHLESEWWLDRHPLGMGALRTRHFLPLIARPGRAISLWLLPALAVMAAFFLALRLLLLRRAVRAWLLLPISMALFFAIGTGVAMIDGYVTAYAQRPQPAVTYPYTQPFASYADVPKVEEKGAATFLRNFSRRNLNDQMANHTRTHPPGPTLFLWAARNSVGRGLVRAWLATVLFSALGVVPVFLMGRDLYGEDVARRGLALYLLVPSVVLFTTTSMDGPMTVFLVTTVWAFLRATAAGVRAWPLHAALSGLAMALASFMTYTVTFLCLFFTVIAALAFFIDRPRFWRILRIVPVAGLTVAAFYGALYAAFDYDPIAAARRAVWANNELVGTGHATLAQYVQVSLSNLFAFVFGMGLALVAVWLPQVRAAVGRARGGGDADLFVLAFPIALLVITFSGLYTLETERIWMFMAPMLALPAARYLDGRRGADGGDGALYAAAGLMALQVVVTEVFSDRLW